MKANELRIFNKLLVNGKIVTIDASDILGVQNGLINYLKPIPLTPEILEKCGFEKSTGEYGEGLPTFGKFKAFFYDGDNFVKQLVSINYDNKIIIKISFVHQLQNLYFALTGEELEINLNEKALS